MEEQFRQKRKSYYDAKGYHFPCHVKRIDLTVRNFDSQEKPRYVYKLKPPATADPTLSQLELLFNEQEEGRCEWLSEC